MQERIQEEDDASSADTAPLPMQDFDTALRLAHHAQRLKATEIELDKMSQTLAAYKADLRYLLRRQTIISLAVGGVCLAATLLTGFAIVHAVRPHARTVIVTERQQPAAPTMAEAPPVVEAPQPAPVGMPGRMAYAPQPMPEIEAPVAAAPVPAPVVAAPVVAPPVAEAPRPVAMGRMEEAAPPAAPAPPRKLGAFETSVTTHLAASRQMPPAAWQPMFEREAKGDTRAKLQVAASFLKGEGVKADPLYAVQLIRQAAGAGNKEAMMWLAYSYSAGNFGKPDPNAAAGWFEQAARAGVVSANYELGRLYEKGVDGAPDPEAALAWYQRGAAAGDAKSGEAVQRLNKELLSENVLLSAEPPQAAAAPQRRPAATQPAPRTSSNAPAAPLAATPVVAQAPPPPDEQDAPRTEPPSAQLMDTADTERGADIRAAQRMLKVLGYKINTADGALGPETQNAIRAYQRDHASYPDGQFSADLLESLTRDIRYGQ